MHHLKNLNNMYAKLPDSVDCVLQLNQILLVMEPYSEGQVWIMQKNQGVKSATTKGDVFCMDCEDLFLFGMA